MSRNLRLAGAASATATVVLGLTATGAWGVGPSLPVQVPSAPVQVQTPQSVPSLPATPPAPVNVPAPAAPSAPPAPVPAPPLPGVAAVVAVSQAPRAPVAAASQGRSSSTPGSTAVAMSSGSGSTLAASSAGAGRTAARERAAAETRRLRAEVRRLRGCLGALPELERHLLAMRVGLGGPAMTRRAAAKQLRISVGRAHRLERRGLRELRAQSRSTGCGAQPNHGFQAFTFDTASTTVPALHPAVDVAAAPLAAAAPAPAVKRQRPRQGVLGETAKSPAAAGGRPSAPPVGSAVAPKGSSNAHTLVIVLFAVLLAATGGLWLLRRRRESNEFVFEPTSTPRQEYGEPDHPLDFRKPERPQGDSWEPSEGGQPRHDEP